MAGNGIVQVPGHRRPFGGHRHAPVQLRQFRRPFGPEPFGLRPPPFGLGPVRFAPDGPGPPNRHQADEQGLEQPEEQKRPAAVGQSHRQGQHHHRSDGNPLHSAAEAGRSEEYAGIEHLKEQQVGNDPGPEQGACHHGRSRERQHQRHVAAAEQQADAAQHQHPEPGPPRCPGQGGEQIGPVDSRQVQDGTGGKVPRCGGDAGGPECAGRGGVHGSRLVSGLPPRLPAPPPVLRRDEAGRAGWHQQPTTRRCCPGTLGVWTSSFY